MGQDTHLGEIGVDRGAAQEVRDLDRPERAVRDAPGNDIGEAGHGSCADAHARRQLDDAPDLDPAGGGHRDNHFLDAEFAHKAGQFVDLSNDSDAVHHLSDLSDVVIDEPDHLEVNALAMRGLSGHHLAGGAGTDHERADRLASARAPEVHHAGAEAWRGEYGEREHGVDHDRGERHAQRSSGQR